MAKKKAKMKLGGAGKKGGRAKMQHGRPQAKATVRKVKAGKKSSSRSH